MRQTKNCTTHKILVMIICKEVLEAAGPVGATPQETEHTLLAAHVAVPRVLFDGCMCRSLTNEEVDTLHTETPETQAEEVNQHEWRHVYQVCSRTRWYLSIDTTSCHAYFLFCQPNPLRDQNSNELIRLTSICVAEALFILFLSATELQCHPKTIKNPSVSRAVAPADMFHLSKEIYLSLKKLGCTTKCKLVIPFVLHG